MSHPEILQPAIAGAVRDFERTPVAIESARRHSAAGSDLLDPASIEALETQLRLPSAEELPIKPQPPLLNEAEAEALLDMFQGAGMVSEGLLAGLSPAEVTQVMSDVVIAHADNQNGHTEGSY